MASSRRDPDTGAFGTDFDIARLVHVVRAVATHANPADPEAAPPAAYEAARSPAGFPDAPGARATRRALGNLGWYELLHLAFHDERSLEHNVALVGRDPGRPVTEHECVDALRIIASRLNAATLRPHQYTEALARMGPKRPDWLPTADRIQAVLQTDTEAGWDRGLRLAGLKPREHVGGGRGIPREDAIDRFIDELGYVPAADVLDEYAKQKGFSVRHATMRYSASVLLVTQRRADRGLAAPAERPRRRPPLAVAPSEGIEPRRVGGHDYWKDSERIIAGLVRAYDIAAQQRKPLTQRLHRALSKEHPGIIPAPSVVDRQAKEAGTTAAAWRKEAQRRRLSTRT